jgi:hypothetical protein
MAGGRGGGRGGRDGGRGGGRSFGGGRGGGRGFSEGPPDSVVGMLQFPNPDRRFPQMASSECARVRQTQIVFRFLYFAVRYQHKLIRIYAHCEQHLRW